MSSPNLVQTLEMIKFLMKMLKDLSDYISDLSILGLKKKKKGGRQAL